MRHHRVAVACVGTVSLALALSFSSAASAAISYTTIGSNYTQNFDSLPLTPTNASLIPSGQEWQDDTATPGTGYVSIPGWYLYHTTDPGGGTPENGLNNHQRLRASSGNSTTGSFYSFGTNSSTDRALGNLTSSTIDTSHYGLRLTNNTGTTLGQITLQYTGEQWRDGGAASPGSVAQSVAFGYAVTDSTPTNVGNFSVSGNPGGLSAVTTVAGLGFTSPTFGATTAASLDGNSAANRVTKSLTFGGFYWAPGQDLWLRWTDNDDTGNDHGLGIDDLTFSANVAVEVNSVTSGLVSSPSTWSDNQAPGPVKNYHVVSGHTVTLDSAFTGDVLAVDNGTVSFNSNGQSFSLISVEAGGNLSESVTGDFTLGTAASTLRVNHAVTFNGFEAGSDFSLAADVIGSGDINFQSNGAGSDVILTRAGGHTGRIRFNGTGDKVRLQGPETFNIIEMNSTGANTLSYESTTAGQLIGNEVIFNQAGTLDHAATLDRLQGPFTVTANATVAVDLTKTFTGNERRLLIGDSGDSQGHLQGSGSINVNGTVAPPSGGDITRNEFEIGGTTPEPAAELVDSYSGTLTANDYVNVEIRHSLPNAKVVINSNALVDMGHQVIASTKTIRLGEVEVNSGGILEVGFEQSSATNDGHHAYNLTLSAQGTRSGSLTLNGGSTTRMQINGTASDQFDRITAQGSVSLNGTLDVLINPVASTGTNAVYSPQLNDTFNIITLALPPVQGDYDSSGTVNSLDYGVWKSTFGDTVTAGTGADGNQNGVIDAGDYAIWRKKSGATSALGSITGTFSALNIVDPTNTLAGSGFTLEAIYSATQVQLKVVTAGSGASLGAPVPEPGTIALLGLMLPALLAGRRTRRA